MVLALLLAVLLIRGLPARTFITNDDGPSLTTDPSANPARYATIAFALALAWLFAWPYVLPWYDALGWALLPLVPLAAAGPGKGAVEGLGGLLLARTTALGLGYLPARQADAPLPSGLGWLQPVIRHGVTPAVLAAATVWLVVLMVRSRRAVPEKPLRAGEPTDAEAAAAKAP